MNESDKKEGRWEGRWRMRGKDADEDRVRR